MLDWKHHHKAWIEKPDWLKCTAKLDTSTNIIEDRARQKFKGDFQNPRSLMFGIQTHSQTQSTRSPGTSVGQNGP